MDNGEDNENSEGDGEEKEEDRGDDLGEGAGADILKPYDNVKDGFKKGGLKSISALL